MGLFANLGTDGLEETQDRLGGFSPLETDIYTGLIKAAYAGKSQGGAQNVTIIVATPQREYRETIYVTNRKGENYFLNKDDKTKKVGLPGFNVINDICLVTDGKPLSEQETAEKVVNVYDPELKREAPKSVDMLVDLIGKEVSLAIVNSLENKNEKSGEEYVPTAETRNVNTIDKVFHTATKMTTSEAARGLEAGEFWDKWVEQNKNKTRDKREIKDGQNGTSGRPNEKPVQGEGGNQRKSLFGNK